jgi:cysteine peptidase C11 family protein
VLAYLVGDHKDEAGSLDDAIASELKAICDAADFRRVGVAVQVDFRRNGSTLRAALKDPLPRTSRPEDEAPRDNPLSRLIIDQLTFQKSHKLRTFAGRLVQGIAKGLRRMVLFVKNLPDMNAASEDVLHDFLRYGREQCEARRYLIYFFGHAFGPMGLFFDRETQAREPNSLRLNDLADAIERDEGHASIILFRDCFMGTLETAFQLKSCADFVIASQAEAPIAGVWPWKTFMASLGDGRSSLDIGTELAKSLADFMKQDRNRGGFADVPYSLFDLSVSPGVVEPLKALVHALESARNDPGRLKKCSDALEEARIGTSNNPKSPGDPALIDVRTTLEKLVELAPDPVAQPSRTLAMLLKKLVPFSFTLLGQHRGVSLYYKPTKQGDLNASVLEAADPREAKKDADQYRRLALCKDSDWGRFALDPLSKT